MNDATLKDLLEERYALYNQPNFIENDPICIPHSFSKLQDIEIMGFWAATLAWGQRITIINKCKQLIELMDNSPYDFIKNHTDTDLKKFLGFKHRTFNDIDTLYFIEFFKEFYRNNISLETAFTDGMKPDDDNIENGLIHFQKLFFSLEDAPHRTQKHVATPARKSACKRINMFLRWMVRKDDCGVDFGLWSGIQPSQLICPFDVHVERVGRKLGLVQRKQADWKTAVELTEGLKKFDAHDPVKYDFALFGMGVEEKY